MGDWKERTRLMVGQEKLARLEAATVAVIGVGGVGGYAAEMLVRSGVGHLIILDSDTVSESNKNRQLLALDSTLGYPKCEVLSRRLRDINPCLELTCIEKFLEPSLFPDGTPKYAAPERAFFPDGTPKYAASDPASDLDLDPASELAHNTPLTLLRPYKIDYLVDAIDTLAPKLSLIKYCVDNGIPLVSSMGAGAKYDITKIRITDISKTFNCPLAYMVRKRLHKMGIRRGFKAVFSEELPDGNAMLPCEDRNKKTLVGTISYMPAVFGCACAQTALQYLLLAE